jgi:uncharacterized damage-inducible protein DinB
MYSTLNEFLSDWQSESAATMKVMKNLTDASLTQRVAPEYRELGRLAWHVVLTLGEMSGRMDLHLDAPGETAPVPATAEEIFSAYEGASKSLTDIVKSKWTDASLQEVCDMYGEQWKNELSFTVLIRHEIHHRAQMTVLMRQAGLPVPGIYGPSKEEWVNYGMPPQE